MALSVDIPSDVIKGNVGTGNAFCAGSLYAIYNSYDDMCMLEVASVATACNLFTENSTDGMLSKSEVEK